MKAENTNRRAENTSQRRREGGKEGGKEGRRGGEKGILPFVCAHGMGQFLAELLDPVFIQRVPEGATLLI